MTLGGPAVAAWVALIGTIELRELRDASRGTGRSPITLGSFHRPLPPDWSP